jgi:hypothetical protein
MQELKRRGNSDSFLTLPEGGGEWSASQPGRALLPGEGPPVLWVGPRAGLDTEARGKHICLCRRLNPGLPVCSQTLY